MKRIVYLLLLAGLGLPLLFEGCKKDIENPQGTPTNPVQPNLFLVLSVVGTDKDLGLVINDPISRQQYAVFGKKDAAGEQTSITHIVQTNPETGAWAAHEVNPDLTPRSTTTSTGQRIEYGNHNSVNRTANVRVVDTQTNATLWEQNSVKLNSDLFYDALAQARALDNAPGFSAPTRAEMVYLLTAAFGTGMGIVGLAAGVVGGAPLWAVAWGAINVAANWKSLAEALENLRTGQPAFGCISIIDNALAFSGFAETGVTASGVSALAIGAIPAFINYAVQETVKGQCGSAARAAAAGTQADPIITGLDGGRLFLHPAGEFSAIKSKNDGLAVQVRLEPVIKGTSITNLSTTTSLAIRTGNDVVSFTAKPLKIHVNGQEIKADFTTQLLQERAFITRPGPNRYEVTTAWGDLVDVRVIPTFNLSWYVRSLNEKRRNQVEGLLGQYNGNPDDDFKDKAGTTYILGKSPRTELYQKYANDWRITQTESILVYPAGKTTESYTIRTFPEKALSLFDFDLADRNKAEQACRRAGITQEPELSMCMIDVIGTGMDEMADQMALGIRLKAERSARFARLSDITGKAAEGAVGLTVGDKIYVGLGRNSVDWAVYDPATDAWTQKALFPAGKTSYVRMGTFVIGSKIYCVGGAIDNTATNALWEYDTQTDQWTRRKDLPGVARYNLAAFAAGGKGYALFGAIGWGLSEADYPTKGSVYQYDPATDTWAQKADFPGKARGNNITSLEFNGMVMVINGRPFLGGGSGGGSPGNDWYEYIPARDVWEKRANCFGGTYYASVGNTGYTFSNRNLMSYDATTDAWSKWPGQEIYVPLAANQLRGIYQLPTLNGKAYLGLGYTTGNQGNKEWWSFTP